MSGGFSAAVSFGLGVITCVCVLRGLTGVMPLQTRYKPQYHSFAGIHKNWQRLLAPNMDTFL